MQVTLPEEALPAKLTLNPELRMNDDEYYGFCMANPDVRFERTAEGEIVIVPPAGGESDFRNTAIVGRLEPWARRDGRGKAFGSSAEFILPTGAALSPDAAWVSNRRLSPLSKEQLRKFLPVCPEFVIEVMSPSDRLPAAKKKMGEWMRAGVELGWLIDGDAQTVYVYQAGRAEAEMLTGILKIAGIGPVAGFELDLTEIWAGL
ncbi:MAG TPA: Uma2 family endonuclease [Bryobacteraceae bacterium]|jgi:Uma2 family endonuclease|nr:Uma2 family endonuclease [Bryobacteraceae bacterium]